MNSGLRLRQIVNVVNLTTPLGLLLASASRSSVSRGPRGLMIAAGYGWRLPHAGAFTVGNVVLFRAPEGTAGHDPVLLGHEERHSTQYAYCLGLPFLLLYGVSAAWSMLRTGNPASGNFFERQAGLTAGGYIDNDKRSTTTSAGRTVLPVKESRSGHETNHHRHRNGKRQSRSGSGHLDARRRDTT